MELFPVLWLAVSATAPVLIVLCLWVAYVFHTYRRKWRTVDLFLLSVCCQDLVTALFCFGFSVLRLIGPKMAAAPCGFVLWGLAASRTFQLTTLASAVGDRLLTIRWPYRYRFSVRRNQIRYHVAVLAVIGVLIGVASAFARSSESMLECSLHPQLWDSRYTLFVLVLYGLLMLSSVGMSVAMELQRWQMGRKARLQQLRTATPEYGTTSTGSSVSSSSSKPLHVLGRQTSRRPYSPQVLCEAGVSEYRWTVVAVVTLLSFAVNHLPFLVMVVLGAYIDGFWSPWHDMAAVWLRLAQGFLFPLVLCLTDRHHWTALKKTLQRRSASADFTGGDDNRYRLYPGDAKSYIKHLGPVAPIGIVTNYKRSSANYGRVSKSRPGRSSSSRASDRPRLPGLPPPKYLVPGIYNVDCVLDKAAYLRSCTVQIQHQQHLQQQHLQQQQQQQQCSDSPGHLKRPLEDAGSCCSIDSAVKVHIPAVDYESDKMRSDDDAAERRHSMALQQDLPAWIQAQEEDHIYATLSDTLSLRSTVAGESCATFSAPEEESDSDDAGSFTTDANDDFEFHDTRPCGGEVRMRPSTALDAAYATYGVVQDYSENSGGYGRIQKPADPPPYQESCNSMAGSRNASYSMNDLDLIDKMDDGNEHADDDGFRTPWRQPRSESLMSLYNPPAEQDPEVVSAEDVLAREHGGVTGDPYSLGQKVMEAIMKNGRSSFVIRRNYVRKAKKRIGLKKHKLVFDCEGIDDGFTAVRRFPFQQHRLGGINAIRRIGSPTSQWHVPVGPAGRLTVISEFI